MLSLIVILFSFSSLWFLKLHFGLEIECEVIICVSIGSWCIRCKYVLSNVLFVCHLCFGVLGLIKVKRKIVHFLFVYFRSRVGGRREDGQENETSLLHKGKWEWPFRKSPLNQGVSWQACCCLRPCRPRTLEHDGLLQFPPLWFSHRH